MSRFEMYYNPSRTRISERLYEDEISLSKLIDKCNKFQNEHLLDNDSLTVFIELDDYEDHSNLWISGIRNSTDKENKQWSRILEENKKRQEDNEKRHYLALKKKFESK